MKHVKKMVATALSLPLLYLGGCTSIPSYSEDYAKARSQVQGINMTPAKAQDIGVRFTRAFNTLGTPEFINRASALYEDELYINDTLSQFQQRNDLIEHFKSMNERVSNVSVKLLNTSHYEDSAYVHWRMSYDFKIFGATRSMDSHGISEIKLNEQDKIVFQQDFWDPADGLFRSLPYARGLYAWLLPFKKSQ